MMQADKLADYVEFFRRKGHRTVITASGLWVEVRPFVFQATPPFNFDRNLHQESLQVFRQVGALVCRYFSTEGANSGAVNGPFVYLLYPPYDLRSLQQKARNQTRRGLERVTIKREHFHEELACLAYPIYKDNILRLGLTKREERVRAWWKRWVNALREGKCLEFWGAWHEGKLVAFSVVAWSPWGPEIVMLRSLASALRLYPNNALVYTIAQDVFRRGASLLSFGLSEFGNIHSGLHHFKVNMGFQPIRIIEQYRWHPALEPISHLLRPQVLRVAYRFLQLIRKVLGL